MGRTRERSNRWAHDYQTADRVRSIVGDPFERYARRAAARERTLVVVSGFLVAIIAVALFVIASL